MGFFDDVARTVTTAVTRPGDIIKQVGNASRGAFGSAGYLNPMTASFQIGADFMNQEDNKKRAEADAEAARERLNQSTSQADRLRAQQGIYAADLKKNALRDYGLLSDKAAANERRSMAEKISENKVSMARRGLLGSGISKYNKAKIQSEAAGGTASKQKQIQDLVNQQVQDAEDLQTQLGLEMGGIQQSMSDQYYRMAMDNMAKRNQSYSDILGAGAGLAGTYAGSRRSA